MHFIIAIFLIISEKILCATSSLCLIHDKCLTELKKFTQVDEFHVYTSLKEAESACSDAKDAYLCVQSAPDCRNPSENAKLSPFVRGSFRLLNEFCGFKSKRRPCCALRTAYLEHSGCYEEIIERLNNCNQKYRKSLDVIFTMQGEEEQKKQRFCSMQWLGKCVKKAAQSYCGKVAAQILKTYVTKAAKPEKLYVKENKNCHGTLYETTSPPEENEVMEMPGATLNSEKAEFLFSSSEKVMSGFCDAKYFKKCHVHLLFLPEYLAEDRLEDHEKFLSVCTGIHDSLECLRQNFERCLSSLQTQKFGRMQEVDALENKACTNKENVLQKYSGRVYCLTKHIQELSQCQADYYVKNIPPNQYSKYFCEFLRSLETCWIKTASLFCGDDGRSVMKDIIQMAAINIHRGCNM